MEAHGTATPPWDLGRPQPALAALAEAGGFDGRVLDVGCGSGENALMIAALGLETVGLDIDSSAVDDARRKAHERRLDHRAAFLRFDIRRLDELGEVFDTVLDSLVFHAFDDRARQNHADGLRTVLRPGGRLHVLCYSDRHTAPPNVPHAVSLTDIDTVFRDGWSVDDVTATTSASTLHPDGVAAWLIACTRR
ncbi:class I SAM-dependent methyltransferase [Catenulispora yoronensis]|uniref:Class I SAM-dependent methyltransferase n=1 Tax=Catenulispora yoronensis TaxID=450799 RepID=A0ABN2V3S0_9ACTN